MQGGIKLSVKNTLDLNVIFLNKKSAWKKPWDIKHNVSPVHLKAAYYYIIII